MSATPRSERPNDGADKSSQANGGSTPFSDAKPNGRRKANGRAYRPAPFDEVYRQLLENGYSPVALIGKRPIDEDWNRWCQRQPSAEEIAQHKGKGRNVGTATGNRQFVGLDIDTDSAEITAAIRTVVPESIVAKRGQRGRADFYRMPGDVPPASRRFIDKNGEIILELLGDGRQSAIPPSVHPDTGKPYMWVTDATLLDTCIDDLPEASADLAERLEQVLKPWLAEEPKPQQWQQRSGPPPELTDDMRKRQRAWALKALEARVAELAAAKKPGRNRLLFETVCALGRFVHNRIIIDAELRNPAINACKSNGLAKENGVKDCESTIDRGLRYALGDTLDDLPDRKDRTSRTKLTTKTSRTKKGVNGAGANGAATNGSNGTAPPTPPREPGWASPGADDDPDEPAPGTPNAGDDFQTADGRIVKSADNIRLAIAKAGIALKYDMFAHQRLIYGIAGYGPELSDAAIDAMWISFEREHKVRFAREHLRAVVHVECHANSFHPVRVYLAGLVWDGTPRIDKWLTTYAGAEDTELIRQFGRLVLIGAVRRVRTPGTKFDTMLVFEGMEGRNKSTTFEVMASPDWFSDDAPLNADARETIERLRGKWIIEAADLSAVKRTDVERLKAFLARKKDVATLKFERETTTAQRECIFVGTTNSSEYLYLTHPDGHGRRVSKTGNRRFWPVKVGTINLGALNRDRDQLWAEAARLEAEGVSLVLPEKLWAAAAEEQEKRRHSDMWEDEIKTYLDNKRRGTNPVVTPVMVARDALNLQLKDLDGGSQSRIYDAMRLAGWTKDKGKTIKGTRYWGPDDQR